MAQTNFTPILLYASSTVAAVPSAGNLTNSATGSEIAINIADKNLFFKDSGGVVNTVPIRQSSTSSNGWLSSTDWNTFNNKAPATSGTSILYGNGTGGFSNVTIGTGVSFVGGTLSATGTGGTVTSVTGTSPVVSSGGTTPAISLATAYGDTLNPYASKTANYVLAAPNGSAGVPTFRALVAADVTGLGTMATQNANAVAITGGTINGTTIGATTATTGAFTTATASTSFASPVFKATNSAGGALQNSSGTNQLQWGAGGGNNLSVDVAININPANAQVAISPTGTGSVTINPATAGTMNNMVIGGTTPLAITGTTITATTFVGSGASLTGVVTSVGATSPVTSSGGTTPTIAMPAATTSVSGYLTSTDWNTFNSKQPAGTYVTSISIASSNGFTGTSSGGATPSLTLATSVTGILKGNGTAISAATSGTDYAPATSGTSILYGNGAGGFSNVTIGTGVSFAGGTLSATGSGGTVTSVAATVPAFLSISGSPITTSGTLAITLSGTALPVANGGTGLTTLTAGYIPYGNGTSAFGSSSNLFWNSSTSCLGVGLVNGTSKLEVAGAGANNAGARATYEGTIKINEAGAFDLQATGGLEFKGSVFASGYGSKIFSTDNGTLLFGVRQNSATWTETMRIHGSTGVSIANTTDPGAGNLRFATNLTNGIYFGASSLLNDYETGTWTPTDGSGAGLSFTGVSAIYTKVGRLVTVCFALTFPTTANTAHITIAGLPYAVSSGTTNAGAGAFSYTNSSSTFIVGALFTPSSGATTINLYTANGATIGNNQFSASAFRVTFTYTSST